MMLVVLEGIIMCFVLLIICVVGIAYLLLLWHRSFFWYL